MGIADCPVCFEEYDENGRHTPKLLPCNHTLCEQCLSEIIEDKKVLCPECKQTSDATQTFPENQCMLAKISRRTSGRRSCKQERCPQHQNEELTLFCKNAECKEVICPECLSEKHQGHAVVSINRHSKDLRTKLECNMEKIAKAKEESLMKTEDCLKQLKKEKENVIRRFDEMIEE